MERAKNNISLTRTVKRPCEMVRHGAVAGGRPGHGRVCVRCARWGGLGWGRGKILGGHAHRGCLDRDNGQVLHHPLGKLTEW
jgi:hypothetical protein